MNISRKILLNLALRLRKDRQEHKRNFRVHGKYSLMESVSFGRWNDAHNSLQAAYQIYYGGNE